MLLYTYATQRPIGTRARSLHVGTPAHVYTVPAARPITSARAGNYTATTVAQNRKFTTKLKTIATKMPQMQFSLQEAMDFFDREEEDAIEADAESDPHVLRNLVPSVVKIEKAQTGVEIICWLLEDAPVFDGDKTWFMSLQKLAQSTRRLESLTSRRLSIAGCCIHLAT